MTGLIVGAISGAFAWIASDTLGLPFLQHFYLSLLFAGVVGELASIRVAVQAMAERKP